jgi:carboxymethylenebutenolidase
MRIAIAAMVIRISAAVSSLAVAPATAQEIGRAEITIEVAGQSLVIAQFSAPGDGMHPAVLVLHGAGGLGRQLEAYEAYAASLATDGFDTYVFTYFSAADLRLREAGIYIFQRRFPDWVALVDEVAQVVAGYAGSNGHVGIVGFSDGGTLAAGAGSVSEAVDAAVVYYGSYPGPIQVVDSFPPLLLLHGDSDAVIPHIYGEALAEEARRLGGEANLVIYPGVEHGFGLATDSGAGADAYQRTIAFLARELLP